MKNLLRGWVFYTSLLLLLTAAALTLPQRLSVENIQPLREIRQVSQALDRRLETAWAQLVP